MKALISALLYSCKDATEKIEKREFYGLSLLERARLNKHLALCDACAEYSKFSPQMDKWLKALSSFTEINAEDINNNYLKTRIIKNIIELS